MRDNSFGIDIEDAASELRHVVEDANNFMVSEFNHDWELSEAYFAGKCNLPNEPGRSSAVKTESRDVIRALMPNVMRTLLQAKKPVEYVPTSIHSAGFAEQQAIWINQQFLMQGGYKTLYNAALESMKMKAGPVKCYWEENPHPEYIHMTDATEEQVLYLMEQEDVVVDDVEEVESPTGGLQYNVKATRYYENGKVCYEAFPIYEFFVERRATDLESAIHGHRRSVKVSEAIAMGLEYENWRELDNDDPQDNDAAEAVAQKRGYNTNHDDTADVDIMNHEFLLSEVYCSYDLDGDGIPEKYVFYLGGTSYRYMHHQRIEDFNIALVCVDPMPFTVIGRSVIDITKESTDNETSLLRAILDNAHTANNPRLAGDPTRTNLSDVVNNRIGAFIRTKGDSKLQVVDVPFTGQGLMPLLEWLERDAETRVGVTKAAQGLDPDAMQSTDKNAVLNTIQLSQGQVELMVRNIIETGLIPLFKMALRLSTRHMSRTQMMRVKGDVVPVDTALFDPALIAVPNVGLGTASPDQKLATLQFIYGQQKEMMAQYGLDNPFTSLSQMYNTLEDMVEIGGIINPGRYFNYVDKVSEKVIARSIMEQRAKLAEQQREMMPLDPGKAHFMAKSLEARTNTMRILSDQKVEEEKLAQRALEASEELDFKRDDMSMERIIRLAELGREDLNAGITREQSASSPKPASASSNGEASQ